ncbi:MAG: hypothetical protein KF724_05425 [Phycisphaeraceae bacterium]|nr:hypothetical protein [Phycisphaeraceae bacterium]
MHSVRWSMSVASCFAATLLSPAWSAAPQPAPVPRSPAAAPQSAPAPRSPAAAPAGQSDSGAFPRATQPAPEAVGVGVIGVEQPLDLAFESDGTLLVAAGEEGILELDPVGMAIHRVRVPGLPEREVAAMALSPDGSIFLIDALRGRGERLSRDGEVVARFGSLRHAQGIALSPDGARIAVADTGSDRVLLFDASNLDRDPTVIGSRGTANGEFRAPSAVVFDPAGRLFVVDSDNHRVQRFGVNGRHELTFGTRGAMPGQFERPWSIKASDGTLLVVDHFNHRVQRFNEDGDFILMWGMHAVVPREAGGRIHYPVAVAADPGRNTFAVAEPFERRVQIFRRSMEGERVPLEPPLSFRDGVSSHFGEGIAVDGTLLAAWEPEASAVVIFDLRQERPTHVTTFGAPGRRVHEIGRITSIAADEASERVWILDEGNDRLVEWTLRRDVDQGLRFDPFMGSVTQAIDFDPIGRAAHASDGLGERVEPIAIARAPGEVLLLDRARGAVLRLDDQSLEPRALLPGADMGFPRRPTAIAVSPDGLQLAILDRDDPERLAAIVPLRGTGNARVVARPPELRRAKAITWIDEETLAATGTDDRLVILALDGSVRSSQRLHGVEDGLLWHPRGVAGGGDRSIFVIDWGNHRMQRYDAEGQWLSRFGIGRAVLRPRMPDAMPPVILPKRAPSGFARPVPATEAGPFPRTLEAHAKGPRLKWTPISERGEVLAEIPLADLFYMRVSLESEPRNTRPLADHFALEADAAMPHHGHGMNLAPRTIRPEGSDDFVVGPMLFHMPGAWELYFDLKRDGRTIRYQDEVIMEDDE